MLKAELSELWNMGATSSRSVTSTLWDFLDFSPTHELNMRLEAVSYLPLESCH